MKKVKSILMNLLWYGVWSGAYYYGAILGNQGIVNILKGLVVFMFVFSLLTLLPEVNEKAVEDLSGRHRSAVISNGYYIITTCAYMYQDWFVISAFNIFNWRVVNGLHNQVKAKNI